jgi:hypothetical protein
MSRLVEILFILAVLCLIPEAHGEVKLDFWHSYTHQPSGIIHYSFQIASYKRGLFFGSCGPSTRSLQWEYDIDLAGPGPVYQKDQITITSEGKRIEVVAGAVTVNPKQHETTFRLQIYLAKGVGDFPGNGTHQVQKLK